MLALGKLLELTLAGREPAEKTQLTVEGVRMRWMGEGALEVRPPEVRDNGTDLLLSAGIHGNETAPIELLDELIRSIARGDLKPRARILFLFGNPDAMRRGTRFVEQDVNRLFNGRHEQSGGAEALRACELEHLAASFFSLPDRYRLHYDLHTAIRGSKIEQFALYPWKEGRQHSRLELARLRAAGMSAVLLQNKPSIVFSAYTYDQLGAEAFTLELGKARPFGQNQQVNLAPLRLRLEQIIEGREPELDENLEGLQLFSVAREVIKRTDAFTFNLADAVENFSPLEKGYVLAEDAGGSRWVVEEEGARIIFPNPKVKNGLRAGVLIVPTDAGGLG
ncbi:MULTISPECIES: succinylglutamate desuccinylase [Pseudomonas syringae group]|uniref:Succinylglutamate desuccinylase n=2 Tax=Pseudomonas syringae group TaxID=136849 RepID=A0A0P9LMC7_PSESX|nr:MULTISPECIES: succinylglutamate desuccinylase [Pseudomonas syringae group]KPW79101.1 Succinylglutamate desuccinylase [Pseudomonas syringae pv. cerasicola]KWS88713.1 succinylglutamate desuccinylase [Pseudomonas syringae pv. cerasicola]PHN69553.1 succinylglutamate desuccinylase [Pseudomonas syringae pv. cerasicola]PHN71040.1 succinylglutamate desuccinylase [Pseudomonas syringae pv. cerasicola]RMS71454.1 Succinylglutamate desuccinylase [Pseudomonas savastanoi]